jgi:drug/metabolite transporter, DME family
MASSPPADGRLLAPSLDDSRDTLAPTRHRAQREGLPSLLVIDAKVLALTTALSFGIVPVFIKMAFRRGGQTGTGLMLALAFAVVVNLGLAVLVDPHWELLTPLAFGAFLVGGLAGNAIGRRWSYQSIDLLGASRSSALRATSPVVSVLLAMGLFGEQVTLPQWAAIVSIVVGGVLVNWNPEGDRRQWLGRGVLYALLAAASYGIRPLILKFGLNIADIPLAAACIGAVAALLYTLVREDRTQLLATRIDSAFKFWMLSGALGSVGLISLTFALAGGDVSVVYPLTASAPLFTVAFTALLLRGVEQITWRLLLGTVLVVAGVVYL